MVITFSEVGYKERFITLFSSPMLIHLLFSHTPFLYNLFFFRFPALEKEQEYKLCGRTKMDAHVGLVGDLNTFVWIDDTMGL